MLALLQDELSAIKVLPNQDKNKHKNDQAGHLSTTSRCDDF